MVKLKPCPYCGSQKVELVALHRRTFVACLECGAQGPEEGAEGEVSRARAAWRWNLSGMHLVAKLEGVLEGLLKEGLDYDPEVRAFLRKRPWLLEAIPLAAKVLKRYFPEARHTLRVYTSYEDGTKELQFVIPILPANEDAQGVDEVFQRVREAVEEYKDLEEEAIGEVRDEIEFFPWYAAE